MITFRAAWGTYLARIAHRQTQLLLVVLYLVAIVPTAAIRRVFRRRSLLDGPDGTTTWHPHEDRPPTLDDLGRMY